MINQELVNRGIAGIDISEFWESINSVDNEDGNILEFVYQRAKQEVFDDVFKEIKDMLMDSPDERVILPLFEQLNFVKNKHLYPIPAKDSSTEHL